MSLCINPRCVQPDHPENGLNRYCQSCGSDLLLQGRYRVMRLLSNQSGFGQVYEAYDRNIPKILKVLKETHTDNPKVLELFQREATVLGRLNHPGVPQVEPEGYFVYYPKDSAQPLHCIVMEKIDGPNLKQWMIQQGNHPISEQQAILWLTQLADVLHLVHQQNYFHRDIKPENIMLRSSGQLVLVDFGAAREMTETYLAHLGASGITTVSSAGYTPPEQEQGQAVPQSDFYALGRTIVYLLTAKTPNDPTIYDSRTNAFNWRIHAHSLSPAFAHLIDDLIAPRAIDRPQTTQVILARLAAIRAAHPPTLPPLMEPPPLPSSYPSQWQTTTLEAPSHSTALQPRDTQVIPEKSRTLLWILAGMVALGVGAIAPLVWRGLERSPNIAAQSQPQSAPLVEVSQLKALTGHTGPINALLLKSDSKTLISGSEDKTIRLWDLETGKEIKQLQGHASFINALVLSPDQQLLYSAGADRSIRLWDLTSGQPLDTIEAAHNSPINQLALSPDGQTLASASADGEVKLWDTNTRELLKRLDGQESAVNALVFSRDGHVLASGGQALQLWAVESGESKTLYTSNGSFINGLAVSPDNLTLISVGADKTMRLWHLANGELLKTMVGHESYINEVVVSRDGQTLFSASADKTVGIWEMSSMQLKQRMTGFDSDIYRFVLLPEGQIVTAGGNDNTLKIWRSPLE